MVGATVVRRRATAVAHGRLSFSSNIRLLVQPANRPVQPPSSNYGTISYHARSISSSRKGPGSAIATCRRLEFDPQTATFATATEYLLVARFSPYLVTSNHTTTRAAVSRYLQPAPPASWQRNKLFSSFPFRCVLRRRTAPSFDSPATASSIHPRPLRPRRICFEAGRPFPTLVHCAPAPLAPSCASTSLFTQLY